MLWNENIADCIPALPHDTGEASWDRITKPQCFVYSSVEIRKPLGRSDSNFLLLIESSTNLDYDLAKRL